MDKPRVDAIGPELVIADKTITEKQLRQRYMQTFRTEGGAIVLKDLANRCFKSDTTHSEDMVNQMAMCINEGKRQVLLHIEGMMSSEGIAKLAEEPEKGSE